MPDLTPILQTIELALRLWIAVPELPFETAYEHAEAAMHASTSTPAVAPELLLAMAYVESRYDATATSRVVGGQRRTGSYPSTRAPAGLQPRFGLYCGPLQAQAWTWERCMALRVLEHGYGTGAGELARWLRDPHVRGKVALALAGYAGGYIGVADRYCRGYPARVLWLERRIKSIELRWPVRAKQRPVRSRASA
jgi:hypothetical protein